MAKKKQKKSLFSRIRNYFFAGAVVLIPLAITLYLTVFIILVFVLSIAVKAITRGVEAKQIIKEEKNSDLIQENQKQNLEVVNQIKELKDLHDKGILNDEEFQKAKEKLLM